MGFKTYIIKKFHSLSLFTKWLFPPFCIHCDTPLETQIPLCSTCLEGLQVNSIYVSHKIEVFATFDSIGPIVSLMKLFKSGKAPYLSKGLGAFMGFQYLTYELPLPDAIIPVPQSWTRSLQVGYNPSYLLASNLGKLLNIPVISPLRRKRQVVRQMKVNRLRRLRLSTSDFGWKQEEKFHPLLPSLSKKVLLLVDDVTGTGATLRCCEQKLNETAPLRIIKMACVKENIPKTSLHKRQIDIDAPLT